MRLTYHGHSCIEIKMGGKRLIIDPFITGNPLAKVKAEEIEVDYILLTHGHGDHVGDAIEIAKRNSAKIIATNELAVYLSWQGVDVHPMNIGGSYLFDFGRVKLTHAFHSSSWEVTEEKNFIYLGMPTGLLLMGEGKTLYHAGDTGLFSDLKMIGELYHPDIAFLPIGDNFTMGPEDAVIAAEWVQAKKVVPIHYNTFPAIQQDPDHFVQLLRDRGKEGIALRPGEQLEI